jgi:uncharacterized membrane protein
MLQLLVGTIMVIVPKKKFNQQMIAYFDFEFLEFYHIIIIMYCCVVTRRLMPY